MCLEDLRLGKGRYPGRIFRTAVSSDAIIPANARRVALLISWSGMYMFDGTGILTLADKLELIFGDQAVGIGFLSVNGPMPPLLLRIEDVGQLIYGPISAFIVNQTTSAEMTAHEILYNGEVAPLIAGINQ